MDNDRNNGRKRSSFLRSNNNKTMRFGISADARLIEKFDGMIVEKSYANRSEAMQEPHQGSTGGICMGRE